jgi:chemotaxis protein CheX
VTIKAEHVNPFVKATMHTFQTIMQLKIHPGQVRAKDAIACSYGISGIIGLSGGAKGMVALSFPSDTALAVARAFIGETSVSTAKVKDAIGELANIIAGLAKKDLSRFKIKISLPTVITGQNHSVSGPEDAMGMVVPFTYPEGGFDLTVCFKSLI